MAIYSAADIQNLGGLLGVAQTQLNAGDISGALGSITAYYTYQIDYRGYAKDAIQVVNQEGAFGLTANQLIIDAVGSSKWSDIMPTVALQLAQADLQVIKDNPNSVPVESDIETYHATVFENNGIPITSWGGAAYAAMGQSWGLGTLLPTETIGGHSSSFTNLSVADVGHVQKNWGLKRIGVRVKITRHFRSSPWPAVLGARDRPAGPARRLSWL